MPPEPQPPARQPHQVDQPAGPDCVVVGGGPGGMLLAYLLARGGVRVTLLESHRDFDRDYRGDSLHPWTLELMDQLGLAEDLLALPHVKGTRFRMHAPGTTIVTSDYSLVDSPFPFVALMPQARFLDFLAAEGAKLGGFTVQTGARVRSLVTDDAGRVCGVGWRDDEGEHELRARLVVAADGRFSRLRTLSELPVTTLDATTDLLWFRMPRRPEDPPEADVDLYFGTTRYVGLLGGEDRWQIGISMAKGGYAAARDAGVEPIRAFLREHLDWLGDRIEQLTGFDQITLLSVELKRLDLWHRPGLLLIGDAAHVISPVGGNGILMALQDAVVAANHLLPALGQPDRIPDVELAAVQAERMPAIIDVQAAQASLERRSAKAREAGKPLLPVKLLSVLTRLPGARARSATRNAYGPYSPRLRRELV